jgi:Protein of unknown function (DUF2938)
VSEGLEFFVRAVVIGVGATVFFDFWGLFLKRFFNAPATNWAMLGRWLGHFPRGRFVHDNIAKAEPVPGERVMGWTAHYIIGIAYGVILLAIWGIDWARRPTLLPALILGLAGLVAPLFVMQPGMGAGIAGSKTPNPNATRLRSLLNHAAFGLGLYVFALLSARLLRP